MVLPPSAFCLEILQPPKWFLKCAHIKLHSLCCKVLCCLVSCVCLFAIPWAAACQASLSFTISQSFLKLMPIESVMPSNHLILSHPLLFLLSIFPSLKVFFSELGLPIRWPKTWSFSFSISPFHEYSGMISFSIDWFIPLLSKGLSRSGWHGN